jgi:hypothetical protein
VQVQGGDRSQELRTPEAAAILQLGAGNIWPGDGRWQQRSCELASAVHLIYLLGDGSGLRSIS